MLGVLKGAERQKLNGNGNGNGNGNSNSNSNSNSNRQSTAIQPAAPSVPYSRIAAP